MKKIITMVLVGLMVFSSFIAVYAEEPNDSLVENSFEEEQLAETEKLGMRGLKEFAEEIHQINALRVESNQLRIQVIEKQDQLFDLFVEAREAGNKEVLKAAREERKQIKGIQDEIKFLHEQAAATRKTFREAVKNNDMTTAEAEIQKLINIHNSINDKKEDKIEVLDILLKHFNM